MQKLIQGASSKTRYAEQGVIAFKTMELEEAEILFKKYILDTGSANSTEQYVNAFESCGDPFGKLTWNISVYGWKEGANKVAATKLIRTESGLNLRDSKIIIDKALKNEESHFSTESIEKSEFLVGKLDMLGFKCSFGVISYKARPGEVK